MGKWGDWVVRKWLLEIADSKMANRVNGDDKMKPSEELLLKIGTVRRRWKSFLWARGLAWVLGVLVVSLVIGLALADSTNMPTWVVTGLRLGMVVLFAFTLIKALILPLRRVPDDTQLARFVEAKNPGLEDR